jgi:hypothetical protein
MPVQSAIVVTPQQAQWIVERFVADGRISMTEVRRILADIPMEIAKIEQRLSTLRNAAPASAPRTVARLARAGKRARSRKGHPRGLAGTLAVLLRSVPAAEHAAIDAIRAEKGIKAAIDAARSAVK